MDSQHALQFERRAPGLSLAIEGNNDVAGILPRRNAIHLIEERRAFRGLCVAFEARICERDLIVQRHATIISNRARFAEVP